MNDHEPPVESSRRRRWRADVAFWAVVSVAGWIVIAILFSVIGPDQASQQAGDRDRGKPGDIAPASGPPAKPAN